MRSIIAPVFCAAMSIAHGRAQSPAAGTSPAPAFEVVSIKPSHEGSGNVMVRMAPGGRFEAHNITVKFLLEEAYGVKDSQILGAAGWLDSEHYNIDAKAEDSAADNQRGLDRDAQQTRLRAMLQAMLADRFKLALHHESKELSEYVLVVAKSGSKLQETTAPANDPAQDRPPGPPGPPAPGAPMPRGSIRMMGRGDLTVSGVGLAQFADVLSRQIGRIVVDRTGLKGAYDFTLKWTPDEGQGGMFRGAGAGEPPRDTGPPPDASGPTIFTALQEQLGLRLESQKGPVDTLVIDHVEKPSEN